MRSTLVGVFRNREDAERARRELLASGFTEGDVSVRIDDSSTSSAAPVRDTASDTGGFSGWLRSLFGDDDEYGYSATYGEAARRGHHLLTVEADNEIEFDRAAAIMEAFGSIDIDEHATQWRQQGSSERDSIADTRSSADGTVSSQPTGAGAAGDGTPRAKVPVVEEELHVGKRQVLRGGVRVFSRIVERPVEETVRLREEHATISRHKVDRPATEADFGAMREGSLEIREMAEQPVVSKSARVVEEIEVGKTATERTETIRDKVRHTEVDVEKLREQEAAMARDKPATKKKRPQ